MTLHRTPTTGLYIHFVVSAYGHCFNNLDGKYLLNPSPEELIESELDLVVAGTKDAVLMVESETSGLSEKIMLDAVKFGHESYVP